MQLDFAQLSIISRKHKKYLYILQEILSYPAILLDKWAELHYNSSVDRQGRRDVLFLRPFIII